jgi:hypothetical protein
MRASSDGWTRKSAAERKQHRPARCATLGLRLELNSFNQSVNILPGEDHPVAHYVALSDLTGLLAQFPLREAEVISDFFRSKDFGEDAQTFTLPLLTGDDVRGAVFAVNLITHRLTLVCVKALLELQATLRALVDHFPIIA